jgi:hypothetical protein
MADEIAKLKTVETAAVKTDTDEKIVGAYKKMLVVQFTWTVTIVLVLSAALGIPYATGNNSPPLLPLVAAAGAAGALFSALTRLYNVGNAKGEVVSPMVANLGWRIWLYASIPPLIGAIAAFLLYIVFVSELVQSPMFPHLTCVHGKCDTILGLMDGYWPEKAPDYGKAFVWSFIAGFSERFVPDLLQSLVKKEQGKQAAGNGKG